MTHVSVIIPTRNRAALLRQAISSVIGQTWPNTELIIVDEASTDGTHNVIRDLANNIDEVVVHEQAQGPSMARNAGVHAASGSHVLFLDDDDLIHPRHVEALIQAAETLPVNHIPSTGWRRFQVKESGVVMDPVVRCPPSWNGPEAIATLFGRSPGCQICGHSVLWPRDLFEEIQWDESLFTNGDMDFFGRALMNGYVFAGIESGMAYYRSHGALSVSGTRSTRSVVSSAKYRLKWSSLLQDHPKRDYFAATIQDSLMRILLVLCSHGGLASWVERIKKAYANWGGEDYYLPQPPTNPVKRAVLEKLLTAGGPEAVGAVMRASHFVSSKMNRSPVVDDAPQTDYDSIISELIHD
jgi:glycosyltransferase involved in cell wall biosynthesis